MTNAAGGDTALVPVLPGAGYTLSEAPQPNFPGADEFTPSAWVCVVLNGVGAAPTVTPTGSGTATITGLVSGQNVACTITNTAQPATYDFDKRLVGIEHLPSGSWQIDYAIDVTNTSQVSPLDYDLNDSLALYGDLIDIVSADGRARARRRARGPTRSTTTRSPNSPTA